MDELKRIIHTYVRGLKAEAMEGNDDEEDSRHLRRRKESGSSGGRTFATDAER